MLAQEKYGADKVIPAVVRAFIHREGPATAHFMGGGMSLTFGSLDPATESVVQEFFEALESTPIKAKIHPDILWDVWMKRSEEQTSELQSRGHHEYHLLI